MKLIYAAFLMLIVFISACSNNADDNANLVPEPGPVPDDGTEPVQEPDAQAQTPENKEPVTPPAEEKIGKDELSSHDSEDDCWIGYKGKVYDVTSYLPKHKGGIESIAKYCGTSSEFEKAFADKHGTSKVGVLESEGEYMGELA